MPFSLTLHCQMHVRSFTSLLALAALLLLPACQEESSQDLSALNDTAPAARDTAAQLPDTAAGTRGPAAGPTDTTGTATTRPGGGIDTTGPGPATIPQGRYTTTASGLKYYDLQPGNGPSPDANDRVRVHYTGWLQDSGEKFDSSYDRGQPATFPLNRVIQGWTEGLQSMQVGGKRQLVVPPDLGYGQQGAGPIPSNATLVFEVELLGVEEQPGGAR